MFRSVSIFHLTLILLVSGVILFVTVAIQQVYRNMANEPQVQMANDLAAEPQRAAALEPVDSLNLYSDQSVFAIYVNYHFQAIASTCNLHGQSPQIPVGVYEHAKSEGINIITWQPKKGTRIALVVKPVNTGGFIAVGRSLAYAEQQTNNIYLMGAIAWALAMLLLGGSWYWQMNVKLEVRS